MIQRYKVLFAVIHRRRTDHGEQLSPGRSCSLGVRLDSLLVCERFVERVG